MPIYVYPDRIEFPNYSLRITSDGVGVTSPTSPKISGTLTTVGGISKYVNIGFTSGYSSGGLSPTPTGAFYSDRIDKFSLASNANATTVGALAQARSDSAGQSSETNGYSAQGFRAIPSGPTSGNRIDKFPFATDAGSTLSGSLVPSLGEVTGISSPTNGYITGGNYLIPSVGAIQKFSFANEGNSANIGSLSVARRAIAGQSSFTNGYTSGGIVTPTQPSTTSNVIDKFPFATDANATDVGDLTVARYGAAGQNSTTHGYTSGGLTSNVIDRFPFATNTNASDVGNLTQGRGASAGQSSFTRGYTSGGLALPAAPATSYNTVDSFPFAATANATDVGDLTQARRAVSGHQY